MFLGEIVAFILIAWIQIYLRSTGDEINEIQILFKIHYHN